jgi:hypothetical protein
MLRRPTDGPVAGAAGSWPDDTWTKQLPVLVEYLSATCYDDATPREPAQLTLKLQDGMILASLQDKDLSRGLYRVAGSVLGACKALEKALSEQTADWRPWKTDRGGKRK